MDAEKEAVNSRLGPHSLKSISLTSISTSKLIQDQSASSAEQISLPSESKIAWSGLYASGPAIEIDKSSTPFVLSTKMIEESPVAACIHIGRINSSVNSVGGRFAGIIFCNKSSPNCVSIVSPESSSFRRSLS